MATCKLCKKKIEEGARKCHHCSSIQNNARRALQDIIVLLSIITAFVTIASWCGARKEASKAEKALAEIQKVQSEFEKNKKLTGEERAALESSISKGEQRQEAIDKEISVAKKGISDLSTIISENKLVAKRVLEQIIQRVDRVSNNIDSVELQIQGANEQLEKLVVVNNTGSLDLDNRVRIKWGSFIARGGSEQEAIVFSEPYFEAPPTLTLSMFGNVPVLAQGKSLIATSVTTESFIPKVADKKYILKKDVQCSYIAFGTITSSKQMR